MLAGMQLDVFTPLRSGPMTAMELSKTLGLRADKLSPLLHALVHAELLTIVEGRFANTPEADAYLVKGLPTYMGGAHELYSDMWSAARRVAHSVTAGAPRRRATTLTRCRMANSAHSSVAFMGVRWRVAASWQRPPSSSIASRVSLDVGGGSGGVAIAACESCVSLLATVLELPRVAAIAKGFVAAAGLTKRVNVVPANILDMPPSGTHDVAVLRYLLQVLSPDQARRALRNVGTALRTGGALFIIGHVLDDTRLSPAPAVGMNLVFLSLYDDGQSYTETEHRSWLGEAGFTDISIFFGAGPNGASIVRARKV